MLIQLAMITITLVGCIIIQIQLDYYQFEFEIYFKELFGIRFIQYLFMTVIAMFSQVVVNKKVLGYIVAWFFIDDFFPSVGLTHHLFRFGSTPETIFSDMNGYGPYLKSMLYFNMFWVFLAILLLIGSILFWIRGTDNRWKIRFNHFRSRISKPILITSGLSLILCLVFGGIIIYNTTVINRFESQELSDKLSVEYEKKFKQYHDKPQPQIVDVKINVDLFPENRSYRSFGSLKLVNETSIDISELFINLPYNVKTVKLKTEIPSQTKEIYEDFGIHILELNEPLLAGTDMILEFDFELTEVGFKNNNINTRLVENGTSLRQSDLIPRLGYNTAHELKNNDKRKKAELTHYLGMYPMDDTDALMFKSSRHDTQWITFDAVVSTTEDQFALTSGELIKTWTDGNRRYFHYKNDGKMNLCFPLVSGRFLVENDHWNDVKIEVYYHKDHDYNIRRMVSALKHSLEYFTKNFGPYQHKIIRIVEFPRYERFAQSLPTIIPYSEAYGFIMRTDEQDNVFRITAHELAHQWWGHQVCGANVQGSEMISETMAQYASLCALQSVYDKQSIKEFSRFELKRYLKGRADEHEKEVPLLFVERQAYIYYGKGFVVMSALQDYLGEEKLNTTIKNYVEKVSFQYPPYTTSVELLDMIKEVTPDSLQYILKDMFESIVLYQNKMIKAKYTKLDNGKYLVKLNFETEKLIADSLGEELSCEINDYINFGIFGSNGKELYFNKHLINSRTKELEFIVDEIPATAGIDPYYFLIDKNIDDNTIQIEKELVIQ